MDLDTSHRAMAPSCRHVQVGTDSVSRGFGVLRATLCGVLLLLLCSCSSLQFPRPLSEMRSGEADGAPALNSMVLPVAREVTPLPQPPLPLTPEVKGEIRQILTREPRLIDLAYERREPHYSVIQEIFADEGVPPELINVALIESNFNPTARSPAGAVGMWQFMKATAASYGLRVNGREDQRKDPVLATLAAARHLRDLYEQYECWLLALAAYNAGSGTVNRAIKRVGSRDFWELSRKYPRSGLRRQTVRYVPRFIAVTYLMQSRERLSEQGYASLVESLTRG